MRNTFTIEAACAFGLEAVVGRELHDSGFRDVIKDNGSVRFQGDWKEVCLANLWLRCANKIRVILATFQATDFEDLFQGVKRIEWERLLPVDARFPVKAKSFRSQLHSTPHIQAVVKKATVERLKQHYSVDWFNEKGATYAIEVEIRRNKVTIALNTSGEGLHKRGYRQSTGEAPLKETLAAALVYLSRWKPDYPLVDPMCGSGTILIEAAQIALNKAPGLNRDFACTYWECIEPGLWDRIYQKARAAQKTDQSLQLYGYDNHRPTIEAAHSNARNANVSEFVTFKTADIKDFHSEETRGYMISNPPYGERLQEKQTVIDIERSLGKIMKAHPAWFFYFLSSHNKFEKYIGKKATKKRKLYNGRIQCYYYQYFKR